jgi:hypothetical protein
MELLPWILAGAVLRLVWIGVVLLRLTIRKHYGVSRGKHNARSRSLVSLFPYDNQPIPQ